VVANINTMVIAVILFVKTKASNNTFHFFYKSAVLSSSPGGELLIQMTQQHLKTSVYTRVAYLREHHPTFSCPDIQIHNERIQQLSENELVHSQLLNLTTSEVDQRLILRRTKAQLRVVNLLQPPLQWFCS